MVKTKTEVKTTGNKPVKKEAKGNPKAQKEVSTDVKDQKGKNEAPAIKEPTKTEKGLKKDGTVYEFNDSQYGKGRLVLAVVKEHLQKTKNVSFDVLKKAFPDELQPRFGVIAKLADAKALSKAYNRYYLNAEDVLKTNDGTQFAICNQWGIGNIDPFLTQVKTLGYKIKTVSK